MSQPQTSDSRRVAFTDGPLAGKVITVSPGVSHYQALEFDDPFLSPWDPASCTWQLTARRVTYSFYQYGFISPEDGRQSSFWLAACHGRPRGQGVLAAMELLGIRHPGFGLSSSPALSGLHVRALSHAELAEGWCRDCPDALGPPEA